MSRFFSRLMVPAIGISLICSAYSLSAGAPKEDAKNDDRSHEIGMTGEVVMIATKSGSSFAVVQLRTRTVAGQSFVGGNTITDSGEFTGNRVWVPVGDISQMTEYDTKLKFIDRGEIVKMMARAKDLQLTLQKMATGGKLYETTAAELQRIKNWLDEREIPPKKQQGD
jgi:hypothetical protein